MIYYKYAKSSVIEKWNLEWVDIHNAVLDLIITLLLKIMDFYYTLCLSYFLFCVNAEVV
jgi:hypothetical protein